MNLEVFLTEHTPEDSFPKKGSFWAMPLPEKIEVSEVTEQSARKAIQKTFSLNVPDKEKIPRGVYFQISYQDKNIFRGHIDKNGEISSFVKV